MLPKKIGEKEEQVSLFLGKKEEKLKRSHIHQGWERKVFL